MIHFSIAIPTACTKPFWQPCVAEALAEAQGTVGIFTAPKDSHKGCKDFCVALRNYFLSSKQISLMPS